MEIGSWSIRGRSFFHDWILHRDYVPCMMFRRSFGLKIQDPWAHEWICSWCSFIKISHLWFHVLYLLIQQFFVLLVYVPLCTGKHRENLSYRSRWELLPVHVLEQVVLLWMPILCFGGLLIIGGGGRLVAEEIVGMVVEVDCDTYFIINKRL